MPSIRILVCLLLPAVLLSAGCSLKVGESVSFKSTSEPGNISLGCLNKIDNAVNDYLAGRFVNKRLNKMFVCVKKSLNIFKTRVYGQNKGEFTPQELRKFIHDFIMQNRTISDKLLHQLSVLKTMIVGGRADKLTTADIDRFIVFLKVLKDEAVFLQPHIAALYHKDNTAYLSKKTTKMTDDFMQSINRLSVFLNRFAKPYSFADMRTLIRELDLMMNNQINISYLDDKIKTAQLLKQFIVNGADGAIQPKEWRPFLLGVSHLANAAIHYTGLKGAKALTAKSMTSLYFLSEHVINFLTQAVQSHPKGVIGSNELLRAVLTLQQAGVVPSYFRKISLRRFLKITLGKAFNVKLKKYGQIELNSARLKKLKSFVQDWMRFQIVLNQAAAARPKGSYLSLNGIKPFLKPQPFWSYFNTLDYTKSLFRLKPLQSLSGKVQLSHAVYQPPFLKKHNYRMMSIHHFYRLIIHIVRMGYQKHITSRAGMTQKEITRFFKDLNPIAEDMGWFQQAQQPGLLDLGEMEFILAKTVTPSTQGYNTDWHSEQLLTIGEMVEYLAYSVSISSSLQEIEPRLSKLCALKKQPGRYSRPCVRKHLLPVLNSALPNMPDIAQAVQAMSPQKRQTFTQALIHISFETQAGYDTELHLTRWRLKNILMAVYFIETIFNRFDVNHDSILQNDEIWAAFPVFHGYLNHVVVYDLQWPQAVESTPDLYAFVIAHKKLTHQASYRSTYKPIWDKMDEAEIYSHYLWRTCPSCRAAMKKFSGTDWTLQMDREHLVRVFSAVIKGFMKIESP